MFLLLPVLTWQLARHRARKASLSTRHHRSEPLDCTCLRSNHKHVLQQRETLSGRVQLWMRNRINFPPSPLILVRSRLGAISGRNDSTEEKKALKTLTHSLTQKQTKETNSVARVCEQSVPTERTPLVGEVSANLDRGVSCNLQDIPYDHSLRFLDRSRYSFFQVAPQLYSRG
jgi:hypothetical protein